MERIDFTIIGEQVIFMYKGAIVKVDFKNFNPYDKPIGGIMRASGILVMIKGEK